MNGDPPPPLTPEQAAEAVGLYLRLRRDREAGTKMWNVTWDQNGLHVGSVNPRFDIVPNPFTIKATI